MLTLPDGRTIINYSTIQTLSPSSTHPHPSMTSEANSATYRRQLDQLGFSFDWSREVRTSSPDFYKWTQWIFMKLFNSWYNKAADKAESIDQLVAHFEQNGSTGVDAVC